MALRVGRYYRNLVEYADEKLINYACNRYVRELERRMKMDKVVISSLERNPPHDRVP